MHGLRDALNPQCTTNCLALHNYGWNPLGSAGHASDYSGTARHMLASTLSMGRGRVVNSLVGFDVELVGGVEPARSAWEAAIIRGWFDADLANGR
jgi:hypothetical protein